VKSDRCGCRLFWWGEPRPTKRGDSPRFKSPVLLAATQPVYSTTMIESRSGAVSLETEEIVIVFEPC
jgi:hypothetical protein